MTGGFSTCILPALSPGLMWNVHTGPHAVTLSISLAGDYNHNGIVDTADYTIWRDTLGSTSDLRADGDSNGVVNAADYSVWKMSFGAGGAPALQPILRPNYRPYRNQRRHPRCSAC